MHERKTADGMWMQIVHGWVQDVSGACIQRENLLNIFIEETLGTHTFKSKKLRAEKFLPKLSELKKRCRNFHCCILKIPNIVATRYYILTSRIRLINLPTGASFFLNDLGATLHRKNFATVNPCSHFLTARRALCALTHCFLKLQLSFCRANRNNWATGSSALLQPAPREHT